MQGLLRACLAIGGRLVMLLAMLPAVLRGDEPAGDSSRAVVVVPRSPDAGPPAQCVALSPDGKLVAAAFGGGTNGRFPLEPRGGGIAIFDRATGERLHFAPEYGDVIQLQFSADGQSLVYTRLYTPGDSIDDNRTVVLDVATGQQRQHWEVDQVAASVAGNLLAIRRAGHVEIHEIEKLSKQQDVDTKSTRVLALSPDARWLATIASTQSDPELRLIELASSRLVRSASKQELRTTLAMVWSPDGKLLATGHTGGVAQLWNVDDLSLRHTFQMATAAHVRPVFAPGGDALWLFSQPVQGMRWTYDQRAASGFKFENERLEKDCEAWSFGVADFQQRAQWRFADATFQTWYARFGRSSLLPEYNPPRFAIAADGLSLLAGCHGAALYELNSGKLVRRFSALEPPPAAAQD